MKNTKALATVDVHVTDKDGGSRRNLMHGKMELQPLEEFLGAPMSNRFIIAFATMQTALKTSLELPDDQKFAIWTANKIRWEKLREGSCAALSKSQTILAYGNFTPEDVALMELYADGEHGKPWFMIAQDHILRILERMDDETVAAFVAAFDERWHALQDVASEAEPPGA